MEIERRSADLIPHSRSLPIVDGVDLALLFSTTVNFQLTILTQGLLSSLMNFKGDSNGHSSEAIDAEGDDDDDEDDDDENENEEEDDDDEAPYEGNKSNSKNDPIDVPEANGEGYEDEEDDGGDSNGDDDDDDDDEDGGGDEGDEEDDDGEGDDDEDEEDEEEDEEEEELQPPKKRKK